MQTDSDYDLTSSQSSMSNSSASSADDDRLSFDGAPSKPHRSSDAAWTAINSRRKLSHPCGLAAEDFELVRKIGSGDIGTVYLCRLREVPSPSPAMYAMKVVDREVVQRKKKMERAETEKRILRILDHPFLPSLYADFDASPHFSCVVMEYCSGGDLHSLRHRQPGHRFPLNSARFYAAEVLAALEYLHMLGVVYRDLKPENILIRSDGHIMLSDFDLSLESTASPTLAAASPSSPLADDPPPPTSCLFFSRPKLHPHDTRRFVAEPVGARSHSFVGTHEYVAPEVASGRAHGSAVDWWAYGVLLYELLYGRTPFVGPTNDTTLKNIVKRPLSFPPACAGADHAAACDLIAGLLSKDPKSRLGSSCGAADVKAHPFFRGLNFALLRSCRPPFVPGLPRAASCRAERPKPDRFDYF